jgi:hypothetical protein
LAQGIRWVARRLEEKSDKAEAATGPGAAK